MKFSLPLAALLSIAAAAPDVPYMSGMNLGHEHPYGGCKSAADWLASFQRIKQWSDLNAGSPKARLNHVKIFTTSDCNALANAIPAAKATGLKIWAGLWTFPEEKFKQEKAALEAAIRQQGTGWLAGVSVGSESMYRKEYPGWKVADMIYDVKGMVQGSLGAPNVPVGTADTWTSWVDGQYAQVITACDVILMNGFPYWQDASINDGLTKLREAIWYTWQKIGGKPLIVGETGWPSAGPQRGAAVASLANTQKYWKDAACWFVSPSSNQYVKGWFWFAAFDEPQKASQVEKNFGIAGWGFTPKVNMNVQQLCSA